MRSEGSQKIYMWYKNKRKTDFGDRIMEEVGVIKNLEIDETKNYILIPTRSKDKEGNEKSTSWAVHEIHEEMDVNFKLQEDSNEWLNDNKV